MVIAFQTLLLGLAFGVQPVSVMVTPEVHSVEFLLDSSSLGTLAGPPWEGSLNLGPEPHPHELVAVARDAAGHEIGRARQWINLPRPQCEVRILLEHAAGSGEVTGARLAWGDVKPVAPRHVRAILDGRPIPIADKTSFPLPACDMDQPHVLSVSVDFRGGRRARADVAFGGHLTGQTEAELTAVPLEVEAHRNLPALAELQRWFTADGLAVRVAAVETGAADVALVLDRGSRGLLDEINTHHRVMLGNSQTATTFTAAAHFSPAEEGDDRLSVLLGVPQLYGGETPQTRGLFDASTPLAFTASHFGERLAGLSAGDARRQQRIADAVAVAGLTAAARGRRRAVVLVLGEAFPDASTMDPAAARRFLADLRVPLFVWATVPGSASAEAWGEVEDTSSERLLDKAARRLEESLENQWIVWIEGLHLPQHIALTREAKGIRLAK
jgi:hypothetical protein